MNQPIWVSLKWKGYSSNGTCAVYLLLGPVEMELKNITYRIDHEGKMSLKPPFRVHSNNTEGIKPKLVPSVVFKEGRIWNEIEKTIKSELAKETPPKKRGEIQLDFLRI